MDLRKLRELKRWFLAIMVCSIAGQAVAQTAPPQPGAVGAPGEQKAGLSGPRKQLATIVFAGLGGAILGLSTLSFYGRPQEKLSNIAIGFAFGIIGGTTLVTYRAATNPQELYGAVAPTSNSLRLLSASSEIVPRAPLSDTPISAGWEFHF